MMSTEQNQYSKTYRIGEIRATVRAPMPKLLEHHAALYADFLTDEDAFAPIRITIEPEKPSWIQRRRYLIRVNDEIQYEPARRDQVLPYLEWAMNFQIPKLYPQFLQFHASSLSRYGLGMIMPGKSGSGKSTLTAALVHKGWDYLCDEFALIHARSHRMHPYPRAVCIKKPSYAPLQEFGLPVGDARYYFKGSKGYVTFINPNRIRRRSVGSPCPVRFIVFPKYRERQRPCLEPISRAEAAFELHQHCFNLLNCEKPGLDIIAAFIRHTTCYRLTAGTLEETTALLDTMASRTQQALANTA